MSDVMVNERGVLECRWDEDENKDMERPLSEAGG